MSLFSHIARIFLLVIFILGVNVGLSQVEKDSTTQPKPTVDTTGTSTPPTTPEASIDTTGTNNGTPLIEEVEEDNTIKRSDTLQGSKTDKILTGYTKYEIELEKGSIISNILKVYNNSQEAITFKVDIIYPGTWKSFNDPNETFDVNPGDTALIPIILIPNKLTNGNTEILINTFVLDLNGHQLANNYFSAKTKKHVSWDIDVNPSSTIYFKNDETIKDFEYTVTNTGNYKQDIFLVHEAYKGGLLITDTNHMEVKEISKTVSLEPQQDTTFKYKVSLVADETRNFRRVSIQNYVPFQEQRHKRYTFYLNSSEPKALGDYSFKKGQKVNFVRLPNEMKINPYGYSSLPLIVEASAQNILGDYAFMSVDMRGYKQIDEKSSITYNTRLNYSLNHLDDRFIKGAPFYIGYFRDSATVEVGQINGNVIGLSGFGKGIKSSYSYLSEHETGAFYVRSPRLFEPARSQSYGVFHTYKPNDSFRVTGKI